MEEKTGVARLRQAIENQASVGEASFSMPFDEASALLRECEDELARLAWAKGVPVPKDADGEVVPLTTKVMYTHMGKKIELSEFDLLHSVLSGGFVWRAIRNTGHGVEDLKLAFLHLRRPDSWERLEEDISSIKNADYPCDYFNYPDCGMPCYSCSVHTDAEDCTAELARDVLRRARKLAERDAKWAGRD
ncbi:MAG: hypothetical protein KH395_12420 [Bacteroides sp.]|nr:hypothetical protein [Bacteroides sp.]